MSLHSTWPGDICRLVSSGFRHATICLVLFIDGFSACILHADGSVKLIYVVDLFPCKLASFEV